MDQNSSHSSSFPRSVCALTCHDFPPSLPVPFNPTPLGLPQGSIFNPSKNTSSAVARLGHPPSNTPSSLKLQASPSNFGSSFIYPNSLPASYNMASGGIYPSATGPISANLAQPYHSLYSSYNIGHPAPPPVAPFNPITSFAAMSQLNYQENSVGEDPSSTTVFVAGLPPCITEETLKTFFQNFGEIAYVKIPPHKGYGFVKYVRREDAKQAILKMNDFPIHEKSRIRLSWGRSLGDKKVEYVKKLSSALGISFESVWKIVQGQDPAAIKQIVSTVCGRTIGQLYEPPKLPVLGLDQHPQTTRFPEFATPAPTHITPLNVFPNVISQPSSSPTKISFQKNLSELPVVSTTTSDLRYSTDQLPLAERKEEYSHRSISNSKVEPSLLSYSRPKALSQGSGSASLPPPSWAMRNSWQELFPNSKPVPQVESPVSSIDSNRFPEVSVTRRATIPSVTPTSFTPELVFASRRYPVGSPASAVFSSSQASSADSMDAATPGMKGIAKDRIPTVKERDEYHLGFDGFLHELLEEEGREDASFDRNFSVCCKTHRSSNLTSEPSALELFGLETPSVTQSQNHSENAKVDWPRTFLGPSPTNESETVKNIFNSMPGHSPPTHQSRRADKPRNDSLLNRLDTWSFQTGDANNSTQTKLESVRTIPQPLLSRTSGCQIQSLDNSWPVSL